MRGNSMEDNAGHDGLNRDGLERDNSERDNPGRSNSGQNDSGQGNLKRDNFKQSDSRKNNLKQDGLRQNSSGQGNLKQDSLRKNDSGQGNLKQDSLRQNDSGQGNLKQDGLKRDNSRFKAGLRKLEIHLEEDQLNQFERYYDILIERNKVMNLTAITDYNEVITKHFLDSLSFVKVFESLQEKFKTENGKKDFEEESESENRKMNSNKSFELESEETNFDARSRIKFDKTCFSGMKMLDLGTGAGFPGIPLKIAFPELEILLVDSLNKRICFLNDVIEDLKLQKISAVHGRAEELGRKIEYREKYDFCVSRAVARLYLLSEYCLPFVSCGGSFISYKSGKAAEEIEEAKFAIGKLGGKYKGMTSFLLPDSEIERNLVVVQKIKSVSREYPRNAGKIAKSPLLKTEK